MGALFLGAPVCQTTPQSAIDNWGRSQASAAALPARLAVRPELTAADVTWLNDQLALTERPPVRYARELPRPPIWTVVSA